MRVFPQHQAAIKPISLLSGNAFSLTELLVVIGIMAIIAAFTVPAINGILRSSNLNRAAQMVEQELSSARMTALAKSRSIEVRLYRYEDPQSPGTTVSYRALQTFLSDENGNFTPVGKMIRLPQGILINENQANSSIMTLDDKAWTPPSDPQIDLPGVGTAYTSKAIQFRSDGSTSLDPNQKWYLTLHTWTDGSSTDTPPPNFATIQIDPVSGNTTTYRP